MSLGAIIEKTFVKWRVGFLWVFYGVFRGFSRGNDFSDAHTIRANRGKKNRAFQKFVMLGIAGFLWGLIFCVGTFCVRYRTHRTVMEPSLGRLWVGFDSYSSRLC